MSVTSPRVIVSGATTAITRRTTLRKAFLGPWDPMEQQCWLYALADAQRHTGVAIYHANLVINHEHLVLTASCDNLPEFTRRLHRDVSCAINTLLVHHRYDAARAVRCSRKPTTSACTTTQRKRAVSSTTTSTASRRAWSSARTQPREPLASARDRVRFVTADLASVVLDEPVDVVFSTATFHWVKDHDALFAALHQCLVPGGRLHVQCGGDNLARIHARTQTLLRNPPYKERFVAFEEPWNFQTPDATKRRLARAGFVAVDASLELAPTVSEDEARYGAFLQTVILRAHPAQLGDDALARAFLTQMREAGAADAPPWFARLRSAERGGEEAHLALRPV